MLRSSSEVSNLDDDCGTIDSIYSPFSENNVSFSDQPIRVNIHVQQKSCWYYLCCCGFIKRMLNI